MKCFLRTTTTALILKILGIDQTYRRFCLLFQKSTIFGKNWSKIRILNKYTQKPDDFSNPTFDAPKCSILSDESGWECSDRNNRQSICLRKCENQKNFEARRCLCGRDLCAWKNKGIDLTTQNFRFFSPVSPKISAIFWVKSIIRECMSIWRFIQFKTKPKTGLKQAHIWFIVGWKISGISENARAFDEYRHKKIHHKCLYVGYSLENTKILTKEQFWPKISKI